MVQRPFCSGTGVDTVLRISVSSEEIEKVVERFETVFFNGYVRYRQRIYREFRQERRDRCDGDEVGSGRLRSRPKDYT